MKSLMGSGSREVLENLLLRLFREYDEVDTYLTPKEAEAYRAYYNSTPIMRNQPDERRLRDTRRFYRGYLCHIVEMLLRWQDDAPLILDAGSGMGLQSLLFAALGAKSRGIDLRLDRVSIAKKRLEQWNQDLGTNLDVEFQCDNLFEMIPEEIYDIIWICQAISHIDPAEEFVKQSYKFLKPGGYIVVVDPNGMFIPNQLFQLRNRGVKVHRSYTTHTGETVPYAVERLFSYSGIKRLLKSRGFNIVHGECHFEKFRGRTDDRLYSWLIKPLDTMPLFSDIFGRLFVVVGRKPESAKLKNVSPAASGVV